MCRKPGDEVRYPFFATSIPFLKFYFLEGLMSFLQKYTPTFLLYPRNISEETLKYCYYYHYNYFCYQYHCHYIILKANTFLHYPVLLLLQYYNIIIIIIIIAIIIIRMFTNQHICYQPHKYFSWCFRVGEDAGVNFWDNQIHMKCIFYFATNQMCYYLFFLFFNTFSIRIVSFLGVVLKCVLWRKVQAQQIIYF